MPDLRRQTLRYLVKLWGLHLLLSPLFGPPQNPPPVLSPFLSLARRPLASLAGRRARCPVPSFLAYLSAPRSPIFPLSHTDCTLRLRNHRAIATPYQLTDSVPLTLLLSKRIKAHTTKNVIARWSVCHYFFCGMCFCYSSLSSTKRDCWSR
jgi:hypothetical protein